MTIKSSSKPAMILEKLASQAVSQRIFFNGGSNDQRRLLNLPLIKVGETYQRMATETEKRYWHIWSLMIHWIYEVILSPFKNKRIETRTWERIRKRTLR